jgi:hypothetical protein
LYPEISMNKRIIASFTLFAFLTLGAPVIADPSGVFVESSQGSITLRGDSSDWSTVQDNGLALGDSVVLGPESQITLLFPDGSRVRVAPDSEFRLKTSDDGKARLYLLRGRIITSVRSTLTVETYRSNAVATEGEFVLETNPTNTGLKVLSGNAHLQPNRGQAKTYDLLTSAPVLSNNVAKRAVLAFGKLSTQQTVRGDEVYGAQGKSKGAGVRREREREKTGGVGRVAPNQDILPPGKNPAAAPPVTNTPPPVTTTAPPTAPLATTPPVTGVPPAIAGASPWPWILGGLGTALGAIALLTDNDGNQVVFGTGADVPSPSLP